MTADEIKKYINRDSISPELPNLVEKYKDKGRGMKEIKEGIISHFGLGFFSAP